MQTQIEIKKLFSVEEISEVDPRLIVGINILLDKEAIILMVLNQLVPLSQKAISPLPLIKEEPGTKIRSIQRINDGKRDVLLVEVVGSFTQQTRKVVEKIAERMKKDNLESAFFPAHILLDGTTSDFFIRWWSGNFRIINAQMKNIRLANNQSLIFSHGKEIRSISLDDFNRRDWDKSSCLYFADANVIFLGRRNGNILPVTLADGVTFDLDIFLAKPKETTFSDEKTLAYVGPVDLSGQWQDRVCAAIVEQNRELRSLVLAPCM